MAEWLSKSDKVKMSEVLLVKSQNFQGKFNQIALKDYFQLKKSLLKMQKGGGKEKDLF